MNENLPTYVVMTSKYPPGVNPQPISAKFWGSGFLGSQHAGVALRSAGDPVLYLSDPKGVDHALLKVSDMSKALQFYRTLYGKKDVRERKTGRVWFPIGDTRLGLEETKYQFGDKPRIAHFGIKVAPFDRAAVSDALTKLGAQILPSDDEPDVLRFKDPDGITVEVKAV